MEVILYIFDDLLDGSESLSDLSYDVFNMACLTILNGTKSSNLVLLERKKSS